MYVLKCGGPGRPRVFLTRVDMDSDNSSSSLPSSIWSNLIHGACAVVLLENNTALGSLVESRNMPRTLYTSVHLDDGYGPPLKGKGEGSESDN